MEFAKRAAKAITAAVLAGAASALAVFQAGSAPGDSVEAWAYTIVGAFVAGVGTYIVSNKPKDAPPA